MDLDCSVNTMNHSGDKLKALFIRYVQQQHIIQEALLLDGTISPRAIAAFEQSYVIQQQILEVIDGANS